MVLQHFQLQQNLVHVGLIVGGGENGWGWGWGGGYCPAVALVGFRYGAFVGIWGSIFPLVVCPYDWMGLHFQGPHHVGSERVSYGCVRGF